MLSIFLGACGNPTGEETTVEIPPEHRGDVFLEINDVLTQQAFALGCDFSDCSSIIQKYRNDNTTPLSRPQLIKCLNDMLHEFKVSHLYVIDKGLTSKEHYASLEDLYKDEITRDESDSLTILQPWGIPYLKVKTFSKRYNKAYYFECLQKIKRMKKGCTIVDLRDNYGGLVENLEHFLNLILHSGENTGYEVTKPVWNIYKQSAFYDSHNIEALYNFLKTQAHYAGTYAINFGGVLNKEIKIILLINHNTASGAEQASTALKDSKEAIVIGKRTRGALLTSQKFQLSQNLYLVYPISDFLTTKGQRIEGKGVKPDFEVPEEKILDFAIEVCKSYLQ